MCHVFVARYFCGEIDMPKTFISETPNVKIIIYVASYNEDTQFQFSTEIQKREEHYTKLGQYHKLHNRRGRLVDGTYCDRVFDDCTPGHCYIHSPGFPEIYNRNLKCRYTVKARKGLVALEVLTLDIDGEKCEGLLICFARPVTTKPEECPHDYVRIYDGANDSSPLISTLCGRGRLQSNVIASGSEMFIEFISSPAGSLIDTGFQLKIENIENDDDAIPMESKNGSCVIKRTIVEPNTSYMFTNIKSWYPPNTTCSYIFSTPHPNDHISLEFLSFRIDRITLCKESIRLFDGLDADPFKLMNVLCDTNKPMGGASEARYVTSGPNLLVQFVSDDGSLDGSAINYRFEIKRIVAAKKVSATEVSKNCSKVITPESLSSGSLTLHPEDFNKSIDGQITCNLTFDATSLLHGRVNLSILSAFNPSLICGKYCDIGIIGNNQAKLTIYRNPDFAHLLSPLCFCEPITSSFAFSFQSHPRVPQQITTISNSSSLTIAFILPPDWGQRKTSIPIQIRAKYLVN
ncbi:hypothetical protein B4U80_09769 [Leptotrombidium deliense]|uniref:CUB domain-containing protein n=1 Tax=Leptotrombidium deliense TaxID=299467 RepID=A0A443SBN2_9ACAR|nr:hypothetical protein B4U80_09769 [Leptotrombidium deliense]